MAIIKLTDCENKKQKYYVNIKAIEYFHRDDKCKTISIVCTFGGMFRVKETPEEILARIKEAENGSN